MQLGKKEKTNQDLLVDLENERMEKSSLRDRIKQLEDEVQGAQLSVTQAAGQSGEA